MPKKTLDNSDASPASKNVRDLVVFGNPDRWQLLCKASSKGEDWLKSTKAYEISGVGCLVQVSTQQGDNVAEALEFVPGVKIIEDENGGRQLVAIPTF
jgi:hypothetical protein